MDLSKARVMAILTLLPGILEAERADRGSTSLAASWCIAFIASTWSLRCTACACLRPERVSEDVFSANYSLAKASEMPYMLHAPTLTLLKLSSEG